MVAYAQEIWPYSKNSAKVAGRAGLVRDPPLSIGGNGA